VNANAELKLHIGLSVDLALGYQEQVKDRSSLCSKSKVRYVGRHVHSVFPLWYPSCEWASVGEIANTLTTVTVSDPKLGGPSGLETG
jgi:hypothetical protein